MCYYFLTLIKSLLISVNLIHWVFSLIQQDCTQKLIKEHYNFRIKSSKDVKERLSKRSLLMNLLFLMSNKPSLVKREECKVFLYEVCRFLWFILINFDKDFNW